MIFIGICGVFYLFLIKNRFWLGFIFSIVIMWWFLVFGFWMNISGIVFVNWVNLWMDVVVKWVFFVNGKVGFIVILMFLCLFLFSGIKFIVISIILIVICFVVILI